MSSVKFRCKNYGNLRLMEVIIKRSRVMFVYSGL